MLHTASGWQRMVSMWNRSRASSDLRADSAAAENWHVAAEDRQRTQPQWHPDASRLPVAPRIRCPAFESGVGGPQPDHPGPKDGAGHAGGGNRVPGTTHCVGGAKRPEMTTNLAVLENRSGVLRDW